MGKLSPDKKEELVADVTEKKQMWNVTYILWGDEPEQKFGEKDIHFSFLSWK